MLLKLADGVQSTLSSCMCVCVCVFEVSFLGCPTSSPKFRILPPHTKKAVVPNPEPESAAKARHVMVGACRAILDLGI